MDACITNLASSLILLLSLHLLYIIMTKNKDWFRIKKYSHIGLPLSVKDKTWVDAYVQNSSNISKHSFFPFIHRTIKSRKFRKEYDKETDNLLNNGKRIKGIKEREIYYANHLDSNIFSYYSSLLSKLYESELITRNLHNVVTAYRHIKHPKKNRGMNNVDFANEVFQYIRSSSEKKIIAITFDIKSFFDNLSHKRIKESWKNLLKCKSLPDDHYNVFKNITNFSFIEHKDIFNEFKNELIKKDKLGKLIKNKVDKIKYMKNHEIIAFCKTEDFDTRIRKNNLIKSNKKISNDNENFMIRNKGIPQGSPISSLLKQTQNIFLQS